MERGTFDLPNHLSGLLLSPGDVIKASPCYTSNVTSRKEDKPPDGFNPEEICNRCGALEGTVCVRGRAETRVKQVSHLSQVQY